MLKSLKISQRLWLMAGLPTLIAVTLTVNGLTELKHSRDSLEDIYQNSLIPIDQLQTIDDLNQKSLIELLLAGRSVAEKGNVGLHLSAIDKNKADIEKVWSNYLTSSMDSEEKALAADYLVKRDAMWTVISRIQGLLSAGNLEQANSAFDHELGKLREAQEYAIDKLAKDQIKSSKEAHEAAREAYGRSVKTSLALASVGMLSVFLIVLFSIRHITNSLAEAGKATTAIANGDLTYHVPTGGDDEFGHLLSQMAVMRDKLRSLIGDMRSEVVRLNVHSNELRNAAGAAARVADNQSEDTSSMAAAVEELSVSVGQVEEHSSDVYRITQESVNRATESSKVIDSAAAEMVKISEVVKEAASDIRNLEGINNEITTIVGVIREVSEQTNLLALNAAIEAARAGESGRGFAVVADEVRKLAERTNASSGEISQMLVKIQEASNAAVTAMEIGVKRVEIGVSLAHGASQSVEEIRAAQARITQAVEDIGTALKEQAFATRDIAARVEKVSQGTEELAATAHQNRGGAEELANSAESLEGLASRFKVT